MDDKGLAGEVFSAMIDSRVKLHREPVCNVTGSENVLYHECCATATDARGNELNPALFMSALERMSLIRLFDRYVVKQAIAALRGSATLRLGINISVQSAVADVVWHAIFHLLEEAPEVAQRLVIEFPEPAWFDAHDNAQHFAYRLKQAGCRIAIDNFGIETAIGIHTPDIIKIDASFVAAARHGEKHVARLARLVRLAAEQADDVVIQGVDEPMDLLHVHECTTKWVQGHFVKAPDALNWVASNLQL
ncbi:EAL domain-containing protein (putative c-di-GMP-specific phosphodiesterase class I) [Paraburkholderia sp. RAU6.4a]|uniref:EAL domain-containing protein n=1 Tax=Paraburkholderia sp. RAU6.4a TaxID=2991067 RepID=UPI003D250E29